MDKNLLLKQIKNKSNFKFEDCYSINLYEKRNGFLMTQEKYISLLIIYGVVSVNIDSKIIKLVEGTIILLRNGSNIKYSLDEKDSKICIINFRKEFFDSNLKSQMADCPILYDFIRLDTQKIEYLVFDITNYDIVKKYLNFLLYEITRTNEKNEKLVKAALVLFLTNLHNVHQDSLIISESSMMENYDVGRWLKYMVDNYSTVSLTSMAKDFNFNPTYFSLRFKTLANDSFSNKLREIKLEKAKWLLITTDLSVQNISEIIEFKEKSYFFRIFKKRYGMTPLKYRKVNRDLRN
ncbi:MULTISPECIES: helix-turn-helix domain-containing protein [unclassified Clostridium]|uniref:helix-turn-helix domain-containing protein n=1 Tax=unclassified Clostridium TaxID=2614128 RepID=UPI0025EDE610|nr:helix-turn-helix transcriptional regulator [Clostridium sp.]MDY6229066.1 helix-turn-helix transcriptional regulator [Clostridium sp.]